MNTSGASRLPSAPARGVHGYFARISVTSAALALGIVAWALVNAYLL